MKQLILYTTLGCHLCEKAQAVIAEVPQCHPLSLQHVDIADDDSLVEQYGIRIPVVKDKASEKEIGWPFDVFAFQAWLESL